MPKRDHGATIRTAIARSGCRRCCDADTIPGNAGASPDDDNAGDHTAAGTTCRADDAETYRRSSRTCGVSCAGAGQHVLRRGLLPQQRRQLCPPASASRHRPAWRHRAVQGRHLQLQPTSARHLLGPSRRRAMVVSNGCNQRQYWQRSTSIARACTRNRPPATASRCLRRALASSGSAVSTTISQLPPYVESGRLKVIGRW
jgi:hypothetical protein